MCDKNFATTLIKDSSEPDTELCFLFVRLARLLCVGYVVFFSSVIFLTSSELYKYYNYTAYLRCNIICDIWNSYAQKKKRFILVLPTTRSYDLIAPQH